MGQAKQRGTREDRVAQAQNRSQRNSQDKSKEQIQLDASKSMLEFLKFQQESDRLFSSLTTPSEINEQVIHFAQKLSTQAPYFLDCQPEPWSRQSCCDANVIKYIEANGGKMICGYRIWYNEPLYIEGERHAVWTDGNVIRDVSFVDTGETKIVFVPDHLKFDGAEQKIRFAFNESDKQILAQFEALERTIPIEQMGSEVAWEIMPTYESWLKGQRMPNLIPTVR